MKQPIELRKVRDFGQIINDSFTFLKENFKPLMASLLIVCGFFLAIEILSSVFTYAKLSDIFTMPIGRENPLTGMPMYQLGAFIDAFVAIVAQSFISLVTICYISVYIQKNNATPTVTEVWGYFKYYFFRAVGSGILVMILFCMGFIVCCVGELALMPYLWLILPIIMIENASFSYAFNKSFRLIKDNWWFTFGIIIVMGLIVGCSNSIATLPLTIISAGQLFFSLKSFGLPLVIIFSIMKSVLMLTYSLSTISICLCYFSFVEQKDGTGLMGRIEDIGKNDADNTNLPAEEY